MTSIRLSVAGFTADRSVYKQYSPHFVPTQPLVVEVAIPNHLVRIEDDGYVMELKGFTVLLDTVASAIEDMHDEYSERSKNGSN